MTAHPFPETISVVVPVHQLESQLPRIRDDVARCPGVDLIIVLNGGAVDMTLSPHGTERVVVSRLRGRGFALVKGAREAHGDAVLFLHSDTVLPEGWDSEVRTILADSEVVGGAFSLSFDTPLLRMRGMAVLSNVWLNITGHLWGDRAMFVRSDMLRDCIDLMQVPIFEDVRLSQQMRKRGKVRISKKKVVTSWEAFRRNGALGQLWLIIKCHWWYIVGWEPDRIYELYYR